MRERSRGERDGVDGGMGAAKEVDCARGLVRNEGKRKRELTLDEPVGRGGGREEVFEEIDH